MKNMKLNKTTKTIFVYLLLIICSLLFLAPFYWMFSTSVKPSNEVFLFPPKWIPSHFKFENFGNAWQMQPFGMFLKNTLIVVVMSTVAQVFSSSLIAYGFARFDFKGKNFLFVIVFLISKPVSFLNNRIIS